MLSCGALLVTVVARAASPQFSASSTDSGSDVLIPAAHSNPAVAHTTGPDTRFGDGLLIANAAPNLPAASSTTHTQGEVSVYVVHEGDTLSQIAELFDVSPNTILWANNITNKNTIKPGVELVILPINGVQHKVEKGETLASIAKKYGGDESDIVAYNDLGESGLTVGSTIVIPNGNAPEPEAPKQSKTARTIATKGTSKSGTLRPAVAQAGWLINPAPGTVETQGIHGYNGVDLGGPIGTPVRAAAAGTVVVSLSSGYNGGYGHYIVIRHPNGIQTLYAHLSENHVAAGTAVAAGQNIGAIGSTGRSTGPHLHFEVRGGVNPF